METIEEIVLRHSGRGMKLLYSYQAPDQCHIAAREILSWSRGTVLLTTGFYVAGHAETDGPAGTVCLAKALEKLGFHPAVVTDEYCRGFFEPEGLETIYMKKAQPEAEGDFCRALLSEYKPVGLISIERCGRDRHGLYLNMRGTDISAQTAPLDLLFEYAYGSIPTIGVGDGGNEIGMGDMAGVIARRLGIVPCNVRTDILVTASVSNWGAYAIAACLAELTGKPLLSDFEAIRDYIGRTVALGSVDGITHKQILSVDGNDMTIEREILESLAAAAGQAAAS